MHPEGSDRQGGNGNPNVEFGAQIRAFRTGTLRLSQTDFGTRYGVSQATVSHWETGDWTPEGEHMRRLRADLVQVDDESPFQFRLPFEREFVVEMRIGPQSAGSVNVMMRLRRPAN
jgi:transcriptional regulator with XRE-family HTH domain